MSSNFFAGLEDTKRKSSTNDRHSPLVGDWSTGAYAFGKYNLEVDNILTKETKRDGHPMAIVEFTVVEVVAAMDKDQNRIDQSDAGAMTASVSHEVGAKVSVVYVTPRNGRGVLTEKGQKAMDRLASAIEAIIEVPSGTLDAATAGAVLEEPEEYTGGLVTCAIAGREWTNKAGNTSLWVQEEFSPSPAA